MAIFIGLLIFGLIATLALQLGKITELSNRLKNKDVVEEQSNNTQGLWLLIFNIVFLVACVVSALYYKDSMLGYGPHAAASEHGGELDSLFNVTLFFTGIVFVVCHIALFWFCYKYRGKKNQKAQFIAHNTNLEVVWTVIPAVVMTFLVVKGLVVWNDIMPASDLNAEEVYEIEATGYQFAWDLRYPGKDGKIGTKNFRLIKPGVNPLGQDWEDTKNLDDFHATELVLPKGRKIRIRITSRDVLHNFYLPHFRVKMDAVPGLPTFFEFTPIKTNDEYREGLRKYPEWQEPSDPDDPDSATRWEDFTYELACAELCGKGHYSMRRIVKVVEPEEFDKWMLEQQSYYMANIRNSEDDPFKGQLLETEIQDRSLELNTAFDSAILDTSATETIINLKHVFFETGSAALKDMSKYELNNVASLMKKYSNVKVELGGHTDNVGDPLMNQGLSKSRAESVLNYLIQKGVNSDRLSSVGYGEASPVESNDTPEGRQSNRRTELKIISK